MIGKFSNYLEERARTMSSADAADDYCEEQSARNQEALDLLEKCWFFGNSRNHKTSTKIMLRCLSDPCNRGGSSSALCRPVEELSKDAKSATGDEEDELRCEEGSSLFDCYAEIMKGKEGLHDPGRRDESERLPRRGLVRAPSLPLEISRARAETSREEEPCIHAPGMNVPKRQVSLNLSDTQSSRPSSKGMPQISGVPSYRSDRHSNSIKSKKSLSDLEQEEVQGFKDLGFSFEDKDMNQNLVSILPGLQEKRSENAEHDNPEVRRPYLSEAWIAQSYAPPQIPKWNAKGSPKDMKAHIKHWARSVASNVRQ